MQVSGNSSPKATPNTWSLKGAPQKLDPEAVAAADSVSISLESPKAEDALLVAGMALAKEKPITLEAPNRSHLPWFLQEADLSYPGKIQVVEYQPDKPVDQKPVRPEAREPQSHDTFIGCLMSGLTKEQYAEGRSHLMEINDTLHHKLGSPDNYCEGIKVGSNDDFGTPKESLVVDLEAVKGSDQCVFYQYDDSSRPSGMWVELGAAVAWGKSCTLFTPHLEGVPEAVKEGLPNLKVVQYGDHDNLKEILKDSPEQLLNKEH